MEQEELKSFLKWRLDLGDVEISLLVQRSGGSVGRVLDRLDQVRSFQDLGALGLVSPWMSDRDVRTRLGRVKHQAEERACFRIFLKHLAWVLHHKFTRKDFAEVSLLEWEVAEAGNPWILVPHLADTKNICTVVGACYVFAAAVLPPQKLNQPETAALLDTAALYAWVRHYTKKRSSQDRLGITRVEDAYRKTKLAGVFEWDIYKVAEFDPSLGLARRHELFNEDLGEIDLGETFAEATARIMERPRQHQDDEPLPRRVTQRAFNSLRRLANEICLTPALGGSQEEEEECIAWKEAWISERELFVLLDLVQAQTLQKREREAQEQKVAEAVEKAKRAPAQKAQREERRTLAGRAAGLSLAQGDSSSSEDDPE